MTTGPRTEPIQPQRAASPVGRPVAPGPCAYDDALCYLSLLADMLREQASSARKQGKAEFSITAAAADGIAGRIKECTARLGAETAA